MRRATAIGNVANLFCMQLILFNYYFFVTQYHFLLEFVEKSTCAEAIRKVPFRPGFYSSVYLTGFNSNIFVLFFFSQKLGIGNKIT